MAIARVGVELVTGRAVAAAKKLQQGVGKVEAAVKKLIPTNKKVEKSFRQMGDNVKKFGKQIEKALDAASRKADRLGKKLKSVGKSRAGRGVAAAGAFGALPGAGAVQAVSAGALAGGPIGAAAAALALFAASSIKAAGEATKFAAEVQKLEIALRNVAGPETPQALQSIRDVIDDFNVPIKDATNGFTALAASSSSAGFSVGETERVYRGLAAANKALGGDTQQLNGIMLAATQVFSKGKVTAEELRGQIGERLPGAFSEFAAATGRSTAQLSKALEMGEVGLDEFVKFSERLLNKYEKDALKIASGPEEAGARLQTALADLSRNTGALLAPVGAAFQDTFTAIIKFINAGAVALNRFLGIGLENAVDKAQEKVNQKLARLQKIQAGTAFSSGRGAGRAAFDISESRARKELNAAIDELLEAKQKLRGSQTQLPSPVIGGEIPGAGAKGGKTAKERVDMTQKMFELSQRLRAEEEAGNERAIATVEHMLRMQGIRESDMMTLERQNALEESTHQFRQDIFAIDKKIADQRKKTQDEAQQAFNDFFKAEQEAAQRRLEADPFFQMKQQLEELVKLENQVAAGATAIGSAFANSFRSVIDGSKSGQEALADMMSSIAEHFMDMATQIIAQQLAMILYGTIMRALGVSLPSATGGGGPLPSADMFTGGFKLQPFAEGGFVDRPTNALIGEGSEPEYVIPESKMRESMARYSRGSRGASVIPEGSGGAADENGGTAVAAPIDVRYTVERINSVDYVTADQFQRGMQSAATQGAKQGEQNTLKRLQMSGSTRRRLGM